MTADSGQADGHVQVIPANEYRRERWRNLLGWTREIARGHLTQDGFQVDTDDTGGEWDWRLSIAEIERDAAFSAFPGIDRELVLLSGHGMRLRFDDGEVHELHPPHQRLRFAGERALTGELLEGPTHDFNLMWRRDRINAELWHRPLVGPMVIFTEPHGLWAVHLLAGRAAFDGAPDLPPLARGDTVLIQGGETRLRHVLHGGGEALMIRLSSLVGS